MIVYSLRAYIVPAVLLVWREWMGMNPMQSLIFHIGKTQAFKIAYENNMIINFNGTYEIGIPTD